MPTAGSIFNDRVNIGTLYQEKKTALFYKSRFLLYKMDIEIIEFVIE